MGRSYGIFLTYVNIKVEKITQGRSLIVSPGARGSDGDATEEETMTDSFEPDENQADAIALYIRWPCNGHDNALPGHWLRYSAENPRRQPSVSLAETESEETALTSALIRSHC
jgi:hypothetical protein